MRITLIPLGVGNLGSIAASLKRLGHQLTVWEAGTDIGSPDWIVLPGVGSMVSATSSFEAHSLRKLLTDRYRAEQPILGVCLGMQIWFDQSEEGGQGLQWLAGSVSALEAPITPHIGWNQLQVDPNAPAWLKSYDGECFYFVHGYAVKPTQTAVIAARTRYQEQSFPSMLRHGPLIGMQFHPELSADRGESLMSDIFRYGP